MSISFNPNANPIDPFRTPDGYFGDFTARIMDRIPKETISVKPVRRTLWQVVRPYLSAAAVIAVVALGTKALQQGTPATGYGSATQTVVATADDNLSQDELYSYLMLDDQSIYAYNNDQQ